MTNDPHGGRRYIWTRGDRLRAARENMPGAPSQADFAAMLGVARSTVVRYEADEPGANKPIVFHRWAEVTGFDLKWLQFGNNEPDPGAASTIWYGDVNDVGMPLLVAA
jgi:transcriptional regulator with XRE-family HTH domain